MSNLTIVSSNGKGIKEEALRKFEATLLGHIIGPDDDGYDRVRLSWTGMTDPRRPALTVRCAATGDVVRAIDFALSNELRIAVRAGGHSLSGDSFCDGGMVIDFSQINDSRRSCQACCRRPSRPDGGQVRPRYSTL